MEISKHTTTEHSFPEESSSNSYATAVQGDLSHSTEETDEKLPAEEMSDDTVINIYTREAPEEKEQRITRGLLDRLGKMVSNRVLDERKADQQSSSTKGLSEITQADTEELMDNLPTNSSVSAESSTLSPLGGWEIPCVELEHAISVVDGPRTDAKTLSSGNQGDNIIDYIEKEAEGGTFVNASIEAQVASREIATVGVEPSIEFHLEDPELSGTNMLAKEQLQSPIQLNANRNRNIERTHSRDGASATGSMVDVSIDGANSIDAPDLEEETSPPQYRPSFGLLRRIGKLINETEPPSSSLAPQTLLDKESSLMQAVGSREERGNVSVFSTLNNSEGPAMTDRGGSMVTTNKQTGCGGDTVDQDATIQSSGIVPGHEAAFSTGHAGNKGLTTLNGDDIAKQPPPPQSPRPLLARNKWIKSVRSILSSRSIEGGEASTSPVDSSEACDLPSHDMDGDDDDAVASCESEILDQCNNGDLAAASCLSDERDNCDIFIHPTRRSRLVTAVKKLVEERLAENKDQFIGTEGVSSVDCLNLSATTSEPQWQEQNPSENLSEREIIFTVEAMAEGNIRSESGDGLENPSTELRANPKDVCVIEKSRGQYRTKWMTAVRKVLSTRSFESSAVVGDESDSSRDGKTIAEVASISIGATPANKTVTETVDKSAERGNSTCLCPSSPKQHDTEVTNDDSDDLLSNEDTEGVSKHGIQGKAWAASVRKVLKTRSFSKENVILEAGEETRGENQLPPNATEAMPQEVPTLDTKRNDTNADSQLSATVIVSEPEQGNARQNLQRKRWITSMRNILSTRSFGGNEYSGVLDVTDAEALPVGDEACIGESANMGEQVVTPSDDSLSTSPEIPCTGPEQDVVLSKPKLHRTRWITSVRSLRSKTPSLGEDVSDLDGSSSAMGPECGEELIEFVDEGEPRAAQSSALNSFMATKGGWTPTDISSGLAMVDEELKQNPPTSRREFLQGLKLYLEQEQVKVSEIRASTEETLPNEAQARVA